MEVNKRRNIFISFIGIDGAGKTTLAKILADAMDRKGIKNKYVACRFYSPLLRFFDNTIIKQLLSLQEKSTDDCIEQINIKRQFFRNRFLRKVSQYFILYNYFLQIFLKVKLPLTRGQNIVCDRYIYDTIIDLAAVFDYSNEEVQKILRNYFHLVPKPDLVFLIDLPGEIAYKRNLPKGDKLSVNYLEKRRKMYLDMIKELNEVVVLDGSKNLGELIYLVKSKTFESLEIC